METATIIGARGQKSRKKVKNPRKKRFQHPSSAKEDGKKKGKRARRKETQSLLITFLADRAQEI
jgi:hypothetical protein